MQNTIDVELFLLIVAREMTYCESIKNALNGHYKGQKNRFYERAKKSKYYNHFIVTEGSLEYEMDIKKIFGILLCADEDTALRDSVLKIVASYKPDLKFFLAKDFTMAKFDQYFSKRQNIFLQDGHKVPGIEVEFWLFSYMLRYTQFNNFPRNTQTELNKSLTNMLKNEEPDIYKEEKTWINDTNWKKKLIIPNHVSLGIDKLVDEKVFYTLGDMLGLKDKADWDTELSAIADIFISNDNTSLKQETCFRDIVRTSAFCLLLDNMLKSEGLNFFHIFTERVISKKDKEYLLKAIAKTLSGTYASILNADEMEVSKDNRGIITISPIYTLAYSDIVLAFLFKGLIRAIKNNKKYAINNYPEYLFADEVIGKTSNAEATNYEKIIDSLKSENEKLRSEIESLKNTIAQKDKNLATAIKEVEAKYEMTIKEKDEFISFAKEQLVDNAEFIYLLMTKYPDEEEVDTEELPPYDLLELQQKRILVVGGRIEKIQELKKLLPKAVFISNETEKVPDTKFDLIFFFNNYLSHSLFSKFIAKAREENISVGYSTRSNIPMALSVCMRG